MIDDDYGIAAELLDSGNRLWSEAPSSLAIPIA